jgi:hypothetical protein
MRSSTAAFLAVLPLVLGGCSSATPDASPEGRDSGSVEGQSEAAVGDGTLGDATSADAEAGDGSPSPADGAADASTDGDAGDGCFLATVGVYGQCMTTAACVALGSYTSTPGYCPGPASIECCTPTPSVADNPPVPTGWVLMQQSAVTSAMTTWAVQILDDPTTYPMFSTTMMTFGTQLVMARVEWHPPDFQNSVVHRGVTLYQPV